MEAETDIYGKVVIYTNPGVSINWPHSVAWASNRESLYGGPQDASFGAGVAISKDGTTVAVGSPEYDVLGGNTGRVQVYENIDGSWIPKGSAIFPDEDEDEDVKDFGRRVGLSVDGQGLGEY